MATTFTAKESFPGLKSKKSISLAFPPRVAGQESSVVSSPCIIKTSGWLLKKFLSTEDIHCCYAEPRQNTYDKLPLNPRKRDRIFSYLIFKKLYIETD